MHPGLLFRGPLKECWIYALTFQFSKSRARWEYLTFSLWLRSCVRFPFVLLWSRVHQSTLGLPATDLHGGFLLSQRILELNQILEVIYVNSFLVQIGNGGSKSWAICPRSYDRVKYHQNPVLLVSCPGLTSCGFPKVLYELLELTFFFFLLELSVEGVSWRADPRGDSQRCCPSGIGEAIGAGCLCLITWPASLKALKELEGSGILQDLKQVSCLFTESFQRKP